MEKTELITINDPKSPVSEAYRTLRTNIQFSSVDKDMQTIMITSSGPGEGKSTTAANLAVVMAEGGAETILIDCDQRKPMLHKKFVVSNHIGLSDILVGKSVLEDAVTDTGIESLYLLTAGTKSPNPSGLLASKRMGKFIEELRQKYQYIIIDTPPVIAVTDAQIVSTYADGCILVVASSQADKDAAVKAKQLLEKVNANILGTVLNKVTVNEKGYYGYYHSYYDEDGKKHNKKKSK